MLNIAICDDEIYAVELMESFIKTYFSKIKKEVFINKFSYGENLLADYKAGKYQIVCMDIVMGEMNGIEAALKIKEMDHGVCIIFTTAHDRYAKSCINLSLAFRYLEKPMRQEDVDKALSDYFIHYQSGQGCRFIFETKGGLHYLEQSDILYFEKIKGKNTVKIVLEGGKELYIYEPLHRIQKQIGQTFSRCHDALIVNLDKIEDFKKNIVKMKNGVEFGVSQLKCREFRQVYDKFIIEQKVR